MAFLTPSDIWALVDKLQELKGAYDEYAEGIEETEFHLRMLQKIISDRDKTAALKANKNGPGRELKKMFDQMERVVRDFQCLDESDGDDEGTPKRAKSDFDDDRALQKIRQAKRFAKKVILASQAKQHMEELATLTKRMEMILKMCEVETASAQAHSLALLAGQGATDLLGDAPECAKEFWQRNFMSRTAVPWASFHVALDRELGASLRAVLGPVYDRVLETLRCVLDADADGTIGIEEFAVFLSDGAERPQFSIQAADDDGDLVEPQDARTMLDILLEKISTFHALADGQLSSLVMGCHTAPITVFRILSHGYIVSGDAHGDVKVWLKRQLGTGLQLLCNVHPTNFAPCSAALIGTGTGRTKTRVVVIGSVDGSIGVLDVFAGKIVKWFAPYGQGLLAIASCPGWTGASNLLYACGGRSTITVYDCDSGQVKNVLFGHRCEVTHLETTRHRVRDSVQLLVSASRDGTIRVWDMLAGVCAMALTPYVADGAAHVPRTYSKLSVCHASSWYSNMFIVSALCAPAPNFIDKDNQPQIDVYHVCPTAAGQQSGDYGDGGDTLDPRILRLTCIAEADGGGAASNGDGGHVTHAVGPSVIASSNPLKDGKSSFYVRSFVVHPSVDSGYVTDVCVTEDFLTLTVCLSRKVKSKEKWNNHLILWKRWSAFFDDPVAYLESDGALLAPSGSGMSLGDPTDPNDKEVVISLSDSGDGDGDGDGDEEESDDESTTLRGEGITPPHNVTYVDVSQTSLLYADGNNNISIYYLNVAGRCMKNHPLRLVLKTGACKCAACGKSYEADVIFSCPACNFNICINCSQIKLSDQHTTVFQRSCLAKGKCADCDDHPPLTFDPKTHGACTHCNQREATSIGAFVCGATTGAHKYCYRCRVRNAGRTAGDDDANPGDGDDDGPNWMHDDADNNTIGEEPRAVMLKWIDALTNDVSNNFQDSYADVEGTTPARTPPLTVVSGRGIWTGHCLSRIDPGHNRMHAAFVPHGILTAVHDATIALWSLGGAWIKSFNVSTFQDKPMNAMHLFGDGKLEPVWPLRKSAGNGSDGTMSISAMCVVDPCMRRDLLMPQSVTEDETATLTQNATIFVTQREAKATTTILLGSDSGDIGVFEMNFNADLAVCSQYRILHDCIEACPTCGRGSLNFEERLFGLCHACTNRRYPIVPAQRFPKPKSYGVDDDGGSFEGCWIWKMRVEKLNDSFFSRVAKEAKDLAGQLWQRRYLRLVPPKIRGDPNTKGGKEEDFCWRLGYAEYEHPATEKGAFILTPNVRVRKCKGSEMQRAGCDASRQNLGICITRVAMTNDGKETSPMVESEVNKLVIVFEKAKDYHRWWDVLSPRLAMQFQLPCAQCIKQKHQHNAKKKPLVLVGRDSLLCATCCTTLFDRAAVRIVSIQHADDTIFVGCKPRYGVQDAAEAGSGANNAFVVEFSSLNVSQGPKPKSMIPRYSPQTFSTAIIKGTRSIYLAVGTGCAYPTGFLFDTSPTLPAKALLRGYIDEGSILALTSCKFEYMPRDGDTAAVQVLLFVATASKEVAILSMKEATGGGGNKKVSLTRGRQALRWVPSTFCNVTTSLTTFSGRDHSKLLVVAGFEEGGILVWVYDADEQGTGAGTSVLSPSLQLLGHQGPVATLLASGVADHLYSASDDGCLHMWPVAEMLGQDLRTRDKQHTQHTQQQFVDPAVFDFLWEYSPCATTASTASTSVPFAPEDSPFLYEAWVAFRDLPGNDGMQKRTFYSLTFRHDVTIEFLASGKATLTVNQHEAYDVSAFAELARFDAAYFNVLEEDENETPSGGQCVKKAGSHGDEAPNEDEEQQEEDDKEEEDNEEDNEAEGDGSEADGNEEESAAEASSQASTGASACSNNQIGWNSSCEGILSPTDSICFVMVPEVDVYECDVPLEFIARVVASDVGDRQIVLEAKVGVSSSLHDSFETTMQDAWTNMGTHAYDIVVATSLQLGAGDERIRVSMPMQGNGPSSTWRCAGSSGNLFLFLRLAPDQDARITVSDPVVRAVVMPVLPAVQFAKKAASMDPSVVLRTSGRWRRALESLGGDILSKFEDVKSYGCPIPLCNERGGAHLKSKGCPVHASAKVRFREKHDMDRCPLCMSAFHALNRRNCSACGHVVCTACCSFPCAVAERGGTFPVCVACFDVGSYAKMHNLPEDTVEKPLLDAAASLTCSTGHPMSEDAFCYGQCATTAVCDACAVDIHVHDPWLHCDQCNEDLCKTCAMARVAAQSGPSTVSDAVEG